MFVMDFSKQMGGGNQDNHLSGGNSRLRSPNSYNLKFMGNSFLIEN